MKMSIKQLLSAMTLLSISLWVSAEPGDPYQLLQDVANKTFTQIKNDQSKIKQNPDVLRDIIKQQLMPNVYNKYSALKVLGKNLRTVPKDKLPEYFDVFTKYLETSLAGALSYYTGQEVVFEPRRNIGTDKDISIKALIKEQGHPDINVAFRLRIDPEVDNWKVYDVMAEGISLLSSKETEYAPILRTEGIQAVIDSMNRANNAPIELKKTDSNT